MNEVLTEAQDLRCQGCVVKPMLARYNVDGGVYVKISGKRSYALHIYLDLLKRRLLVHCPVCHRWSELQWNQEAEQVELRILSYGDEVPNIDCTCMFQRYAEQQAYQLRRERNGHDQA